MAWGRSARSGQKGLHLLHRVAALGHGGGQIVHRQAVGTDDHAHHRVGDIVLQVVQELSGA
mgnify:CR=1 FL=1